MDSKIKALNEKIELAHLGGGEKRIERQHQKKKLTARERVHYLLDDGSFEEIGILVILPYLEGHFQRRMLRKYVKSWIWL